MYNTKHWHEKTFGSFDGTANPQLFHHDFVQTLPINKVSINKYRFMLSALLCW